MSKRPSYARFVNKPRNTVLEQYSRAKKVQEHFENETRMLVPEIYACFGIVLSRHGYTQDEIEMLFNDTQTVWNESLETDKKVQQICLEETGIDVEGE